MENGSSRSRSRLYKPETLPRSKLLSPHHHHHPQHYNYNNTNTFKTFQSYQTTHSQWRALSRPSTTSLRPSRAPPLVPARRPTRRLPRTTTSTSAPVCPLPRTPLATRSTRPPTRTRPRPTSSTPRPKCHPAKLSVRHGVLRRSGTVQDRCRIRHLYTLDITTN